MSQSSHQSSPLPRLVWLGIFGIAMGLLEAIVVTYLRELYFSGGFRFPLRFIPQQMLRMEVLREICTIAMLTAVAAVSSRTFVLRQSAFLFLFGIWDIFYYVFLKILLDWPASLFTWDVLFLIPMTWIGPVLAPMICSLTMISLGLFLTLLHNQYGFVRFGTPSRLLLVSGAAVIFLTFIWDYALLIIHGGFVSDIVRLGENNAFQSAVASYVPTTYHWDILTIGETLVLAAGVIVFRETAEKRMTRRWK